MKLAFWGTLLFGSGFLAHFAVWKIRVPARQAKTMACIIAAVIAAGACLLRLLPEGFSLLGFAKPGGPAEFAHIILYALSLLAAYIVTYPAIAADSPSLLIIDKINSAKADGISRPRLEAELDDEKLLLPRLRDLEKDGMALFSGGKYRLTPKGRAITGIFEFWRALLGKGKGG